MSDPTNSGWWERMKRAEEDVSQLERWQRDVIAEITSVKTDVSTIKSWFQVGTVALLGIVGSVAVWLITGHKP